jgi:hypothetical protein
MPKRAAPAVMLFEESLQQAKCRRYWGGEWRDESNSLSHTAEFEDMMYSAK